MPRSAAQTRRMIPIASTSASTDSGPRSHRPAPRADPLPERARAEPELDPPAAQPVERGGGLGQQRRVAQRQVGDVREQPHALGAPGEVGEQRPGVEVAALVRVVLDADQVEPEPVGEQHLLDHRVLTLGIGDREDAEQGFHRAAERY